jgi:hypothetical protein
LTQTLLEAREKKDIPIEDELFDLGEKKQQGAPPDKAIAREPAVKNQIDVDVQAEVAQLDEEDVTTNLEEPRSQSGIYWKSEFESYRAKTNQEIKKLIQYRSIAKSYAKAKEAEASRLADKLRRYEGKVDRVERNVSQLAAGMASDQDSNAEGMVKELSKQTALVLRYKHQVDSLKKALERHGVFEDGVQSAASERSDLDSDMRGMERLVAASEAKVNELEKENLALKRNLAKAKEEMAKYEDRRKAKESKLKEREQKLRNRVEAYSAELRGTRKRHKDVEEQLRSSFAAEKTQLQDTITELRQKLLADHAGAQILGTKPETDKRPPDGQHRQSFEAELFLPKISSLMDEDPNPEDIEAEDDTEFALPRQKTVREYQNPVRVPDECTETDFDLMTFDESTPKRPKASVQAYRDEPIPPSSPPLQGDDTFPMSPNVPKHLTRPAAPAPSPRPSMVYMSLTSRKSGDTSRQRNKADAMTKASRMNRQLSLAADANMLPSSDSAGSVAAAKLESMSAERVAAAKARLKRKQLEAKGIGKENVALLG